MNTPTPGDLANTRHNYADLLAHDRRLAEANNALAAENRRLREQVDDLRVARLPERPTDPEDDNASQWALHARKQEQLVRRLRRDLEFAHSTYDGIAVKFTRTLDAGEDS